MLTILAITLGVALCVALFALVMALRLPPLPDRYTSASDTRWTSFSYSSPSYSSSNDDAAVMGMVAAVAASAACL